MLRTIEYLIPAALDAIDTILVVKYPNGIPSGYQSAVSGFGTSLRQMGLLPTLAVYTDKDSSAEIKRDLLLKALVAIVIHPDSRFDEESKGKLQDRKGNIKIDYLLRIVLRKGFPDDKLNEHLMQAALVFKLAIRTYKLVKK